MSLSHMVILGIVILLVVPPEKLPELMRTLGRLVNDIKRQTSGLFSDVKNEFQDVKKDITNDIKLTPDDMLKKLTEKNSSTQNPNTESASNAKANNQHDS